MTQSVEYKRISDDEHLVSLHSQALSDIRIDYGEMPLDERGGTSVKLLGASCLYCFAATLGSAMKARNADVKSMTGKVELIKGKDEIRRTKVLEMIIYIEVDIDDEHEATFEKCKKIMERGCLLTYSLEDAIDIEYEIVRKL